MAIVITTQKESATEHVSFVSYTYERYCLCSGTLVLKIDGALYAFGYREKLRSFWVTGGSVTWNPENIKRDRWKIDAQDLPTQFRKYADEIDVVFNDNVPWGCCGGCI